MSDEPQQEEPAGDAPAAVPRTVPPVPARASGTGRLVLAFAAGAIAVAGALVVQHLRHGWPFSLHHGLPADGGHASHAQHSEGDAGPMGPSRVPVDLAAERASAMGISVVAVERRPLTGELRTVATVVPDEARVSHVHTRVSS